MNIIPIPYKKDEGIAESRTCTSCAHHMLSSWLWNCLQNPVRARIEKSSSDALQRAGLTHQF